MKKELLTILALFSASLLFALGDGETRTAKHTVTISATDGINILGKHTYMEIETWSKNEVEVTATLTFDGSMNDRIKKFLDEFEANVKKNIYSSGGELTIDTSLEEPNRVQVGSRHVGFIIGYSDKELRIEYKIKLPGKNSLNIKAAYKDLLMNGDYSDVNISQYSADLRAGSFTNAKLYLKYGDSKIQSLESGYIESYENDTDFGTVGYLKANDKYSEYKFHNIEKMDIVGYETDIKANNIGTVNGNLKYGEMKVGQRLGSATFTLYEYDIAANEAGSIKFGNTKYGNYEFGKIEAADFASSYEDEFEADYVNILNSKSKYGDYSIQELGMSFKLLGYEDDISISRINTGTKEINVDGKYLTLEVGLNGAAFTLNADVKYGKIDYNESSLQVNKYIKENDKLYIEAIPKNGSNNTVKIEIKGYEVDADIE